ncbi:MAG TPA: hypothetical protein VH619_08050, partial [Verrucomicrobiae bacterium]|nr:hypothetical protein [Verrucomicrobiae bacterium]
MMALSPTHTAFGETDLSVGPKGNSQFETPVNQRLTPAGTLVELDGMRPQALALSPDHALLVTSGKTHQLVVLDARSGKILQRVEFPQDVGHDIGAPSASEQILDADPKAQLSFTGLTFSPDGSRIYLSNVQ